MNLEAFLVSKHLSHKNTYKEYTTDMIIAYLEAVEPLIKGQLNKRKVAIALNANGFKTVRRYNESGKKITYYKIRMVK